MYLKANIRGRRLGIYFRRVQEVRGINSDLGHGKSAIFLDCDKVGERRLRAELATWLTEWNLPYADYLTTGRNDSYHVYVFCSVDFAYALRAACAFEFCDPAHLLWSKKRGHFTLRYSPKGGRAISWQGRVDGVRAAQCGLSDFVSFTRYQTARWD